MTKIKLLLVSLLIFLSSFSFSQNVSKDTSTFYKQKDIESINLRLDNYRKTYYNGLKVALCGGIVSGLGTLVFINGVRNEFKEVRNFGGGLIFIGGVVSTVGFCINISAPKRLKLNNNSEVKEYFSEKSLSKYPIGSLIVTYKNAVIRTEDNKRFKLDSSIQLKVISYDKNTGVIKIELPETLNPFFKDSPYVYINEFFIKE